MQGGYQCVFVLRYNYSITVSSRAIVFVEQSHGKLEYLDRTEERFVERVSWHPKSFVDQARGTRQDVTFFPTRGVHTRNGRPLESNVGVTSQAGQ